MKDKKNKPDELRKKKTSQKSIQVKPQRTSMQEEEPKKRVKFTKDKEKASKEKNKKQGSKNKEFITVTYIFVGLFLCLIGYLVYFNVFRAKDVVNNPNNMRQELFAKRVVRGEITSSDGEVLARTDTDENGIESRVYPYSNMYAHIVGYSTNGRTGIELLENFNLLTSDTFFLEKMKNEFQNKKNQGDTIVSTLNHKLQSVAYQALEGKEGAIVVMEPDTGKVLAMVSKPDYDPNLIATGGESLEGTSKLMNRATQGLYPPGSTFKILTALAYMRENPDYESYNYNCEGSITVDGETINCYDNKAHGQQNLKESFANSCNTSFANIGLNLKNEEFSKVAKEMLFDNDLPLDTLAYSKSVFPLPADASNGEVMQTAIGQGNTLTTPMHMALITSAIANGGKLMNPYFVEKIENDNGDVVKKYMPSAYKSLMSAKEAQELTDLMTDVVLEGTASGLAGQSYTAAGKTGSAEYKEGSKDSHAWFVGFSNVEDPDIVVSVIIEGGGSGGKDAVPIAKRIFDAYYN